MFFILRFLHILLLYGNVHSHSMSDDESVHSPSMDEDEEKGEERDRYGGSNQEFADALMPHAKEQGKNICRYPAEFEQTKDGKKNN